MKKVITIVTTSIALYYFLFKHMWIRDLDFNRNAQ
ncbi:hypothetical protein V063_01690 [Staphylococcus aureus R0487]|nr:hypothetical protein V063_01690 [Staphylococcus aureus R0487]